MFFGAVMTAAGLVAVFGTQTRRSFGNLNGAASAIGGFFPGMWMFLRNRDFRVLWISFTLSSVAVVVNYNLSFHFLKWYAGVESHQWLSIIQGSFYTGIVIGVAGLDLDLQTRRKTQFARCLGDRPHRHPGSGGRRGGQGALD